MKDRMFLYSWLAIIVTAGAIFAQPEPGDVYKEFSLVTTHLPNYDVYWRVTDPKTINAEAKRYLPNKELTINVDDLDGAIKAELVIDRWGGHVGTKGKKFRVNSNDWISIPERAKTIESFSVLCYLYQDNPVVEIPLEQIVEGDNIFQGTSGEQICFSFGWGQWGWYALKLRIYYDESKPHPTGEITSPGTGDTLQDNPMVTVSAQSDNTTVESVNAIGYYRGVDIDGDGVYEEWQRQYEYASLENIVWTDQEAPYEMEWNTRFVPDQEPGIIKLIARIKDSNGYWYVTDIVDNLTLHRDTLSVQMYTPRKMPEKMQIRNGGAQNVYMDIDSTYSLGQLSEAYIHLRTWNGMDHSFLVNGNNQTVGGANHRFAYGIRKVGKDWLKYGGNTIRFYSDATTHGIEVLWPGPMITVAYNLNLSPNKDLCDINGNGISDLDDLVEFILLSMREPGDSRLDWDGDGVYTIADPISMLLDINAGTCPEFNNSVSLASARRSSEISNEELKYLKQALERLDLSSEQLSYLNQRLKELSGSAELPMAAGFSLDQNFPNPFNPSTAISFTVGGGGENVSLKVYDIRGSLVRTLIDGFRDEGSHSVFWNGKDSRGQNVASGVYVYRLQAGRKTLTRKMVLLK